MGSAAPVGGDGGAGGGLRVDMTASAGGSWRRLAAAGEGGTWRGGGLRKVLFLARSSFS